MTLALVNVSNPFARQLCEQQYRSNLFLACLLVPYVPLARFLKKFALLRLRDIQPRGNHWYSRKTSFYCCDRARLKKRIHKGCSLKTKLLRRSAHLAS